MSNDNLKQCLKEVQNKVNVTAKNAVAQRKLSKHKYSFSEKSLSEQLVIWDYIWNNSPDFWTRIQSFLFLESHMKNKNIKRVSAIAFAAATEKLKKEDKERLKKIRKLNR